MEDGDGDRVGTVGKIFNKPSRLWSIEEWEGKDDDVQYINTETDASMVTLFKPPFKLTAKKCRLACPTAG